MQIDKIEDVLALENYGYNFPLVFVLFITAIWLKFFPINFYFNILKSRDLIANFLLSFAFIINGAVGFYLLLRVLLPLFDLDVLFLNGVVLIGFILVFYSNYKMLKVRYLKAFGANFLVTSLGFTLITFFVEESPLASQARLLYVVNYMITGLIIFLLANFLQKKYQTNHFKVLVDCGGGAKLIIILTIIFILLGLPFAIIFWANWFLVLASIGSVNGLLVIVPTVTTNLAMVYLATSWISTNK